MIKQIEIKQIEIKQIGARGIARITCLRILCFIAFMSGGCFQLALASVVTDFNTDGAAWLNDTGSPGLTKISLGIKDDSPIKIDFAEYLPGFPDERFGFFILTKIPQGLSNLRFRFEKEHINLDHAPHYLEFNYLTRESSSSSVTNVNSGADYHELWFDFSQEISAGGAVMLNFSWVDFNLPDSGAFSLSIGINENNPNHVPIPAAIWFFATGTLGIASFGRRKQQNNQRNFQ